MKAMIFAAGLGTRLRPLTSTMPKALIEVGGKPMLLHAIEQIKAAGITEVVVNVHHFPDTIERFVDGLPDPSIHIRVSDERELLLDTGGGLLHALELLGNDEPILLFNADILTDYQLTQLIAAYHAAPQADAMLLTDSRSTSRYLLTDADSRMRGWTNVATGEVKPAFISAADYQLRAFNGIHIVGPQLLRLLHEYAAATGPAFSIMPFYIDNCGSALNIFTTMRPTSTTWFDVGKPQSLAEARQYISGIFPAANDR